MMDIEDLLDDEGWDLLNSLTEEELELLNAEFDPLSSARSPPPSSSPMFKQEDLVDDLEKKVADSITVFKNEKIRVKEEEKKKVREAKLKKQYSRDRFEDLPDTNKEPEIALTAEEEALLNEATEEELIEAAENALRDQQQELREKILHALHRREHTPALSKVDDTKNLTGTYEIISAKEVESKQPYRKHSDILGAGKSILNKIDNIFRHNEKADVNNNLLNGEESESETDTITGYSTEQFENISRLSDTGSLDSSLAYDSDENVSNDPLKVSTPQEKRKQGSKRFSREWTNECIRHLNAGVANQQAKQYEEDLSLGPTERKPVNRRLNDATNSSRLSDVSDVSSPCSAGKQMCSDKLAAQVNLCVVIKNIDGETTAKLDFTNMPCLNSDENRVQLLQSKPEKHQSKGKPTYANCNLDSCDLVIDIKVDVEEETAKILNFSASTSDCSQSKNTDRVSSDIHSTKHGDARQFKSTNINKRKERTKLQKAEIDSYSYVGKDNRDHLSSARRPIYNRHDDRFSDSGIEQTSSELGFTTPIDMERNVFTPCDDVDIVKDGNFGSKTENERHKNSNCKLDKNKDRCEKNKKNNNASNGVERRPNENCNTKESPKSGGYKFKRGSSKVQMSGETSSEKSKLDAERTSKNFGTSKYPRRNHAMEKKTSCNVPPDHQKKTQIENAACCDKGNPRNLLSQLRSLSPTNSSPISKLEKNDVAKNVPTQRRNLRQQKHHDESCNEDKKTLLKRRTNLSDSTKENMILAAVKKDKDKELHLIHKEQESLGLHKFKSKSLPVSPLLKGKAPFVVKDVTKEAGLKELEAIRSKLRKVPKPEEQITEEEDDRAVDISSITRRRKSDTNIDSRQKKSALSELLERDDAKKGSLKFHVKEREDKADFRGVTAGLLQQALLKMNGILTNEQITSVNAGQRPRGASIRSTTAVKAKRIEPKEIVAPTDEETELDVVALMKHLKENSDSLFYLCINNQPNLEKNILQEIFRVIEATEKMKHLSLAMCGIIDSDVKVLARAIRYNEQLETLNLESNIITQHGLAPLMTEVSRHPTLREVKISNQKQPFGGQGEALMADAIERNDNILKFGYSFMQPGPRNKADRAIIRHNENLRQRRRKGEENIYDLKAVCKIRDSWPQPWIIKKGRRLLGGLLEAKTAEMGLNKAVHTSEATGSPFNIDSVLSSGRTRLKGMSIADLEAAQLKKNRQVLKEMHESTKPNYLQERLQEVKIEEQQEQNENMFEEEDGVKGKNERRNTAEMGLNNAVHTSEATGSPFNINSVLSSGKTRLKGMSIADLEAAQLKKNRQVLKEMHESTKPNYLQERFQEVKIEEQQQQNENMFEEKDEVKGKNGRRKVPLTVAAKSGMITNKEEPLSREEETKERVADDTVDQKFVVEKTVIDEEIPMIIQSEMKKLSVEKGRKVFGASRPDQKGKLQEKDDETNERIEQSKLSKDQDLNKMQKEIKKQAEKTDEGKINTGQKKQLLGHHHEQIKKEEKLETTIEEKRKARAEERRIREEERIKRLEEDKKKKEGERVKRDLEIRKKVEEDRVKAEEGKRKKVGEDKVKGSDESERRQGEDWLGQKADQQKRFRENEKQNEKQNAEMTRGEKTKKQKEIEESKLTTKAEESKDSGGQDRNTQLKDSEKTYKDETISKEEERQKRLDESRKKREEEKRHRDEERKKKFEEEQIRREEEQIKREEERKKRDEERKKRDEERKKKFEEERMMREEEKKIRNEERKKREEERNKSNKDEQNIEDEKEMKKKGYEANKLDETNMSTTKSGKKETMVKTMVDDGNKPSRECKSTLSSVEGLQTQKQKDLNNNNARVEKDESQPGEKVRNKFRDWPPSGGGDKVPFERHRKGEDSETLNRYGSSQKSQSSTSHNSLKETDSSSTSRHLTRRKQGKEDVKTQTQQVTNSLHEKRESLRMNKASVTDQGKDSEREMGAMRKSEGSSLTSRRNKLDDKKDIVENNTSFLSLGNSQPNTNRRQIFDNGNEKVYGVSKDKKKENGTTRAKSLEDAPTNKPDRFRRSKGDDEKIDEAVDKSRNAKLHENKESSKTFQTNNNDSNRTRNGRIIQAQEQKPNEHKREERKTLIEDSTQEPMTPTHVAQIFADRHDTNGVTPRLSLKERMARCGR